MDGIVIRISPTSNALLFYNPRNTRFYGPESYRLDPYRIPGSMYSYITYDGGLFCSLVKDGDPLQEKAFSPGTRVTQEDPSTHTIRSGTVVDIPLDPTQPAKQQAFLIELDFFTKCSIPIN